jgi:hypothetical protein
MPEHIFSIIMPTENELLPSDLQQLLQLFSSLPDVRFPDLDATALQTSVARVKERHLELMHIEAQLEAVRQALDEELEGLLRKGHRLHAYLRVFAEHDEVLHAKVEAVSLPRLRRPPASRAAEEHGDASSAPAPRKRGRPRKVQTTETLFPGATESVVQAMTS